MRKEIVIVGGDGNALSSVTYGNIVFAPHPIRICLFIIMSYFAHDISLSTCCENPLPCLKRLRRVFIFRCAYDLTESRTDKISPG